MCIVVVVVFQGLSATASTSAIRPTARPSTRWARSTVAPPLSWPDHAGRLEAPTLEQLDQQPPLGGDRNVLVLAPLRVAVAEEIEKIDGEALRQDRRDLPPEVGPARCPVDEHDWGALAEPIPGQLAACEAGPFAQPPVGHRQCPPLSSASSNDLRDRDVLERHRLPYR